MDLVFAVSFGTLRLIKLEIMKFLFHPFLQESSLLCRKVYSAALGDSELNPYAKTASMLSPNR